MKMLIIEACGHDDEELEIKGIENQAQLYGIEVFRNKVNSDSELTEALKSVGKYDFVYLSSHGDKDGFENECGTINISWFDFGAMVCETDCLEKDGILLLSCCRGGLNEVAYDMFWNCPNIEYVVGPRQSLNSADILVSFQILLFNLVCRNLDPVIACDKVLKGTDIRFKCFDRLETMSDPAYIIRKIELDKKNKELEVE